MKTQEQKLQHVMEAAGECWHESNRPLDPCEDVTCKHCNTRGFMFTWNSSPDDLNELFRLVIKLQLVAYVVVDPLTECTAQARQLDGLMLHKFDADSPHKALLNALFIATGGIE